MKQIGIIIILMLILMAGTLLGYELNFNYEGAKFLKSEGNKEVYTKPNGMIIEKYPDKEVAELPGRYKIVRYAHGRREVSMHDGLKIMVDYDGSTVYHYPNGKKSIVTMDGKTPYGIPIEKRVKSMQIKDLSVQVRYSPELSDNHLTKYTQKLYDTLITRAYVWMQDHKKLEKKIEIVISNCHFNKTGYCRRKNKQEIEVIVTIDGKKQRAYQMHHQILFKDATINNEVKKIIDGLL